MGNIQKETHGQRTNEDWPVGLAAITGTQVQWFCAGGDDVARCGVFRAADLAHIEYQNHRQMSIIDAATHEPIVIPTGAMIALPQCPQCEGGTFLKADYTLRDFRRRTMYVENHDANGRVVLRVLKNWHARNLVLHHLLFERGQAPTRPVLPLAPQEVHEIQHEGMEVGILYAYYWTWHLLTGDTDPKRFGKYLMEANQAMQQIPAEVRHPLIGGHR